MKEKEVLAGVLAEYFKYYKYSDAIVKIRNVYNQQNSSLNINWDKIKKLIQNHLFDKGEALYYVAIHANLPLDEDSEEEAYKWLNLFVDNVESNSDIIEY